MSISEEKEILLSQLVDHELPADQANQILAGVFDELADVLGHSETGRRLKSMLQLRQSLSGWRQQAPPRTIVALPTVCRTEGRSHVAWRMTSLAAAAVLGGIVVAGGFYLSGWRGGEPAGMPMASQPVIVVTPEQRREIARAFALHESVAGPLSWYAADDSTIQVAPVQKGERPQQPIAVVLRLVPAQPTTSTESKTYVIVCRNNDAATIELPPSTMAKTVRLRVLSSESRGVVNFQYVLAADGSDHEPDEAALAGHRRLGLGQTSLGQLAMDDRLVNVDASAWVMQEK